MKGWKRDRQAMLVAHVENAGNVYGAASTISDSFATVARKPDREEGGENAA